MTRTGIHIGLPCRLIRAWRFRFLNTDRVELDRAVAAGIEERKIANVTRHKNLPVLRGYIRAATAFDDVGEVL